MKLRILRFLLSVLPAVCMAALLLASPALAAVGSDGSSDVILTVPVVPEGPPDVNLVIDDGGGERNPLVQGAFPPGAYQVWVGTYGPNQAIPYRLGVTEIPQVNAHSF